jgi:hypothetical protein
MQFEQVMEVNVRRLLEIHQVLDQNEHHHHVLNID